MRRVLFATGLVITAVLLTACADQPSVPGSEGSESPTPSEAPPRLDAYEALVRYLVNPAGPEPIYVLTDLCSQLMELDPPCSDHLTPDEQDDLQMRLQDLGEIVFTSIDGPGLASEDALQEILLGPILEKQDGLRIEGGSVCGGLCGSGAVYKLVATDRGYEIDGTDDTYGAWIA